MKSSEIAMVPAIARRRDAERWSRPTNMIAVLLSSLTLVAMAFMITIDVVLRYVFSAPLPASVEISQLMQPYVVLLPMAYTMARGAHVQVTLVTMRLPPRVRSYLDIVVHAIDLAFFAVIAVYGWHEFYASYEVNEIMLAAIRLPWWVGKFALPVGLVLICFQAMVHIVMTVDDIRRGVAPPITHGGV